MRNHLASALVVGLLFAHCKIQIAAATVEGSIAPYLGRPQFSLTKVFDAERFPNIVVTQHGTLIASFGSKSVAIRRSTDAGQTWGPPIELANPGFQGGGMTVDETTGDILAFVEDEHPPAPLTIYRSKDDGLSWQPESPTILRDSRGNLPSMHMNEHGITLRRGRHQGRLIRPSRYYGERNSREEWPKHYTNAMFSDDGGVTWQTSHAFPENGTGEACIVELSSGVLYYNSRVHWQERPNNRRRRSAFSYDGGMTWADWKLISVLPDGPQDTNYGCMGGLTRLNVANQDILIYSNCDSPSGRHHGTVWASFDGGKTWPLKRLVFEGRFAYSSLSNGRPKTPTEGWIYLHFEGGPEGASTVARFNLSWILEGSATGDGVSPEIQVQTPRSRPKPRTNPVPRR